MKRAVILSVGMVLISSSWREASLAEEKDLARGQAFFESKIRPVLVEHCYSCHSQKAKKVRGNLYLDSREGIRVGGDSGPAVTPGKPAESLLLNAMRHEDFEMPPDRKLPRSILRDIATWIEMGAPDPRGNDRPGVIQPRIDVESGRQFWAFRPVQQTTPPEVGNDTWPRDDLDRFILARLEAANLSPVPDAQRSTLIRRVYFDLIGLPPSPAEVDSFLNDAHPQAFARVVDRLLESPQFGERWGRHWLDVAHYAESNGNVRNFTMPHAWRYRDWVIGAFNNDLPYDQFVTQQLAGDLLSGDSPQEMNAKKTATGFLVMMSKPQKGATLEMDLIAEEIEVSTRAFMALTVACARCHDHKFDPIPTRDYYALAGVFTSSDALYGGTGANGSAPKTTLHVLATGDDELEKQVRSHHKEVAALKEKLSDLQAQAKAGRRKGGKGKKKTAGSKKGSAKKGSANRGSNKNDVKSAAALRRQIKQVAKQLKSLADGPAASAVAMGMRDSERPQDCRVYLKGEKAVGEPVPRGFVEAASIGPAPVIPSEQSGRLQFARWLTDGRHPLTARVMVNRIWHHLFGQGLVRTVDNFGVNGERPSHPELLDHLAGRFVAKHQWSVKQMIRDVVLSRTYQLSSQHQPRGVEVDPENLLCWRHNRRRLEGEAIRDAVLAASGQLKLDSPGPSAVAQVGDRIIRDGFTVDEFKIPNTHRSIYLPIIRNGIPDILNVFDFADPSLVVGRRDSTTVPAQELFLMNAPFMIEQAGHFARDLLSQESLTTRDRAVLAYRRALGRAPSEEELRMAADFVGVANKEDEQKHWTTYCQAILMSAEFRFLR